MIEEFNVQYANESTTTVQQSIAGCPHFSDTTVVVQSALEGHH